VGVTGITIYKTYLLNSSMYKWTKRDTEICKKAKASGMAYDKYTGKPLNIDTLHELSKDYDRVRDIMSINDFMKKRVYSMPFED